MMTADETQIQIALGFLDSCTDDKTGFLPSKTPVQTLPEPFAMLSKACEELPSHYHGAGLSCRAWLDGKFAELSPNWEAAIQKDDLSTLAGLMTQSSLLCHAYLCDNARGDGLSSPATLPTALDWLWARSSEYLDVPKAGNFYALVTSNWKLEGVSGEASYDPESILDSKAGVLYPWLAGSLVGDLNDFTTYFLSMEAKGARVVELIKQIFGCILSGNSQEATYHMMVLSANISSLSAGFYQAYKQSKAAAKEFAEVFQPTLVLGEERGASGLQSCTFQVLESFFGLNPESEFAKAVIDARALMTPEHRKLLKVMDQSSANLRHFVESARSTRLLEAYNRCLSHMKTWRLLYVKRGGLLSRAEQKTPVETQSPLLAGDWGGMEWSLDSLFRFLTEEQRASMSQQSVTLEYKAGDEIIQQGNLFPGLFELISGSATVRKTVAGKEEVVDSMGVNEVFGEMSLVENLPASASIVADVDLQARQVSLETVYDLINEHSDAEGGFYLALGQLISHRFRKTIPAVRSGS